MRTARRTLVTGLALISLTLLCFSAQASASKEVVDFFGGRGTVGGEFTEPSGVAVNYTGAGGVPAGTIYVTDGGAAPLPDQRGSRVQRFQRNDSGTPADTADDTYSFVSAWGAGVDAGGTNYEICTVAADCTRGASSAGNGTLAGNGVLNGPSGIAVDQDTGEVYVIDGGRKSQSSLAENNARINVYSATGAFLRSFGWDVIASGPNDNGTGYEICEAGVDVCKQGLAGGGVGQVGVRADGDAAPQSIAVSPPDGNPVTGTVFLADRVNQRVSTYDLDGSSPGAIGSAAVFHVFPPDGGVPPPPGNEPQPEWVAVDSRGILYATNNGEKNGQIERYDTENANGGGVGFLDPILASIDEVQNVTIKATAGQFRLSFGGDTTADLDFDSSYEEVQAALRALPSIGSSNVFAFGGPGNVNGSQPYGITFAGEFGGQDVEQVTLSNGTTPLSGGAGASGVSTAIQGYSGALLSTHTDGLAVDPDSDGAGPDSDVLYIVRGQAIQQFGPLNPPGLTVPPSAADDAHGTAYPFAGPEALAVEPPTNRLYLGVAFGSENPFSVGVLVLDNAGPPPTATLDSFSGITARSVIAHATIDPNGPPDTSYRFEYSTDQVDWVKGPTTVLGHQEDPQAVEERIGLGGTFHPNTHYYVRLVAERRFAPPIVTSTLDFTTASAPPIVETTGSPIRTATTAGLSGRVVPSNAATEYHFEYGSEGPCSTNPCASTASEPAGSGDEFVLVAAQLEGLEPNTTYHYRLIAENGHPSGPAAGADKTITTRASDAPLTHDRFSGPVGSDRAYEQVSLPDTGGNPVLLAYSVSDDGNGAFYRVLGGTPLSGQGSLMSALYAERIETGPHQGKWQSSNPLPAREALVGSAWLEPGGPTDLSEQIFQNSDTTSGAMAIWRVRPGLQPVRLLQPALADFRGPVAVSDDGSRVVTLLRGAQDPAHTPPNNKPNLYDVSTGTPKLIGLMPDGSVPSCGASIPGGGGAGAANVPRAPRWVSDDGSLVFFQICAELYVRDLVAEETKPIGSGTALIKSMPGSAFVFTGQSLNPDDPGGGDLYRYDLADETFECVTCVVPGLITNVGQVAVADDGSRVYFRSSTALIPGAATAGLYRLNVASGDLAYVGPAPFLVGEDSVNGNALTADGSAFVFVSDSPALDPLGGQQNGGTQQFYRYDDRDRSLTCLSCPQDGSAPAVGVDAFQVGQVADGVGANRTALSADGKTFAFGTPNALLSADQNTARPGQLPRVGTDVYEWRDGRLLMVTDGLTSWPDNGPEVTAVTPSGRDIFFTAGAQYTQDAPDTLRRLYTARIGGGFEFPPPPKPCPLEVCQGTPKGAPEKREPGSRNFSGPGNKVTQPPARRSCPKGRHKARKAGKTRCVKTNGKKQRKQRAKHDRRAQR